MKIGVNSDCGWTLIKIWRFDWGFKIFIFHSSKNLRSEQNRRYKHFRFKQTSNNCMAIRFLKLCGTEARSWMGHTRHQLCKRSQTTFSCLQVQTFKLFIICSIFLVQTSKQHQYLQVFFKNLSHYEFKWIVFWIITLKWPKSFWGPLQTILDHCSYFL